MHPRLEKCRLLACHSNFLKVKETNLIKYFSPLWRTLHIEDCLIPGQPIIVHQVQYYFSWCLERFRIWGSDLFQYLLLHTVSLVMLGNETENKIQYCHHMYYWMLWKDNWLGRSHSSLWGTKWESLASDDNAQSLTLNKSQVNVTAHRHMVLHIYTAFRHTFLSSRMPCFLMLLLLVHSKSHGHQQKTMESTISDWLSFVCEDGEMQLILHFLQWTLMPSQLKMMLQACSFHFRTLIQLPAASMSSHDDLGTCPFSFSSDGLPSLVCSSVLRACFV